MFVYSTITHEHMKSELSRKGESLPPLPLSYENSERLVDYFKLWAQRRKKRVRAESSMEDGINDLDGVVPDSEERKRLLVFLTEMCEELEVQYNVSKLYAIVNRLVKYFTTSVSAKFLYNIAVYLCFTYRLHICLLTIMYIRIVVESYWILSGCCSSRGKNFRWL